MSNKHQNEIFLDKVKDREWKSNRLFKPFAHCDLFQPNEKLFLSELDDYLRMRTKEEKMENIINYHIHPSVQTIGDNLGIERKNAEKVKNSLVAKGVLKQVPSNERPKNAKGNQTYYYLVFNSCFESSIEFKNIVIADRNKEKTDSPEWKQINKWLRAFSKAAKLMKDLEEFTEMIKIFKTEYKNNIEVTPIITQLESKGFENKESIEELKNEKTPKSNVVKGNFKQDSEPVEKMEAEPVPDEEFDIDPDFNGLANDLRKQFKEVKATVINKAVTEEVKEEVKEEPKVEEKKTTIPSGQRVSVDEIDKNKPLDKFTKEEYNVLKTSFSRQDKLLAKEIEIYYFERGVIVI